MFRSKRLKIYVMVLLSASLVFAGCSDDETDANNDQTITDAGSDAADDATADTAADADDDAGSDAAEDTGQDASTSAVVEVDCDGITADHTVGIVDSSFDPATLAVSAGEVVQWTNNEPFPIPHTVTSGRSNDDDRGQLFDSGDIAQGDSYCLRFDEVGSFQYFCKHHPVDMNDGEITVE